MDPNKIPNSPAAIQKLAQKEFRKKAVRNRRDATINYREGDPTEKVWDNYQLTKGLKREFKELCAEKDIVASKYIRACIRLLIKNKGDVKKSLKAVDVMKIEDIKD